MLINSRPSLLCGKCREEKNCICKCHDIDLTDNKHYFIQIEQDEIKVKPVIDLDHFRN